MHLRAPERETIQYVGGISLYPFIFNYLKFPVGNPVMNVGDACKEKEADLRMVA
jgi:hypothetical protein